MNANNDLGLDHEFAWEYSTVPSCILDLQGNIVAENIAWKSLILPCNSISANFLDLLASLSEKDVGLRISVEDSDYGSILRSRLHDLSKSARELLKVITREAQFEQSVGGAVTLLLHELPLLNRKTGRCSGIILSAIVHPNQRCTEPPIRISKVIEHELMWDLYSYSYDRVLPKLFFYSEALERHFEWLSSSRIEAILDLGAGTGLLAEMLLKHEKAVIAIVSSPAMLRHLRTRLARYFGPKLKIFERTAESLAIFRDEEFDAANVLLAFFDMCNPWAAFYEACRVVKVNGILTITEPKQTFNVSELMSAGKNYLEECGQFIDIADDWHRLEAIAPRIAERISRTQSTSRFQSKLQTWSAETMLQELQRLNFEVLSVQESHLSNCLFIVARKTSAFELLDLHIQQ